MNNASQISTKEAFLNALNDRLMSLGFADLNVKSVMEDNGGGTDFQQTETLKVSVVIFPGHIQIGYDFGGIRKTGERFDIPAAGASGDEIECTVDFISIATGLWGNDE